MRGIGGVLAVAAFAAGFLVPVRTARACGACVCFDARPVVPMDTNAAVPLNARFFVTLGAGATPIDPATLRLATVDQNVDVSFRLDPAGSKPDEYWLVPSQLLEPSTVYRIEGGGSALVQFQTGTATDDDAPVLGDVTITTGGSGATCEPYLGASLMIASMSDPSIDGEWTMVELHVAGAGNDETILLRARFETVDQTLTFGTATDPAALDCLAGSALAYGDVEVPLTATVTVYDWAGHSAVSPAIPFTLGATEPGGCGGMAPPPTADAGASNDAATPDSPGASASGGCATAPVAPIHSRGIALLAALAAWLGRRQKRTVTVSDPE